MLTRKEIIVNNQKKNREDILTELGYALDQLKKGKLKIVLELEADEVTNGKKRYFAMVRELAIECGYQSSGDIAIFKEQIRAALGNESIADMNTYEQIRIKIEELHQFANETYNYRFKVYDTTIVQFGTEKNNNTQSHD